jgi:hypothetical protein
VGPDPSGLAFEVEKHGPVGVVGGEGIGKSSDGGSDSARIEERAERDGTVAFVGDLVAEGLFVDEDALTIESPDGKPRWLGTAVVAQILGGLQSKRIAAESAGATTDPFPQWFAAQPATSDGFEPGEKEGELLAAEDVAVECDLGGLPTLDDGEQAGDATCVFDQASCEGKFEASLHASAGF